MTPKSGRSRSDDIDIQTSVDDEAFDELDQLAEQRIVYVHIWEDSVTDALAEENNPADINADGDIDEDIGRDDINSDRANSGSNESYDGYEIDLDLYLEDGVYFELYAVLCYTDPAEDPLSGASAIRAHLQDRIRNGLWLEEVAVDEEDALVLVLSQNHAPVLYLVIGAWTLDEWRELPDDADNT